MTYNQFAYVYDELMKDAPYEEWLAFFTEQLRKHSIQGRKILDLACGTGEITIKLAKLHYEVSGVDLSDEMLFVAQEKAREQQLMIPFYQQDMARLDGLGLFDCVTIFCDSLNYLQEEEDVLRTFQSVFKHLNDGGLFLFDVHSIYKMEAIFANQTFAVNDEIVSYIWNSFPGEEPYSVEHDLSFFVLDKITGQYNRFDEFHYQRTFLIERYEAWLAQAGFDVQEILYDFGKKQTEEKAERILFVAKK